MPGSLSQITRQLLEAYGRYPRKKLGQHFLVDPGVLKRIIDAAELTKDDLVIEIGSGLGVVTAELAQKAGQVVAVEIDSELVRISRDVLKTHANISFVTEDILDVDLAKLAGGRSYKLVGNLPYYITAPIIEKLFEAEKRPELAVLMVQKEVAERMAAAPGSKKYGSFSVFVQYHSRISLFSRVSRSSFHPWPEVSSAVVVIKPYTANPYGVKDEKLFFDLVHAAFQQRRKKLRNSLADFNFNAASVDLNRRPETLSIKDFVELTNSLTPRPLPD